MKMLVGVAVVAIGVKRMAQERTLAR